MKSLATLLAALSCACSFEGAPVTGSTDASIDASRAIDAADETDGGVPVDEMISCDPIGAAPPGSTVVTTVSELEDAVDDAQVGETIALASGTYSLSSRLEIRTDGVTLRSESGDPSDVVITGPGTTDNPSSLNFNVLFIAASDVTVAGLTLETAQRGIRIDPDDGGTLTNIRIFDVTVRDFLESGIEVREGDSAATDGGLIACSRITSTALLSCNSATHGINILGAHDNWRVSENSLGPMCTTGNAAHGGVRTATSSRFTVIDHNRIFGFRQGVLAGSATPASPACDGPDGSGWDTYQAVVCNNEIVYDQTVSLVPATQGIFFRNSCDSLAVYNTIAWDLGPGVGLRLGELGSAVDYANNVITAGVFSDQSPVTFQTPNLESVMVSEFVAYPGDVRLTLQPGDGRNLETVELAETYCSWDLDGKERDPANPGYGAYAP